MTKAETALYVALIGATATILVAILGALATYFSAKRERRRLLYGEATKAAVGWKEQLYRIRRRQAGQEADLVASFHDLQDRLTYHQAWIGSESKYMQRSYDLLVALVKEKTEPLITQAWGEAIRPVPGNATAQDVHPDISAPTERFLLDVRSHLSPLFWRKWALRWRNRKDQHTKEMP